MVLPKAFINKKRRPAFDHEDENRVSNPGRLELKFPANPSRRFSAGFTVLEIMMVMALLMILSSLGLFMSMESLRGGSFRNDRAAVISALQRARSLAVNNMCFGGSSTCNDGKPHGVYFNPGAGGVTIFQIDAGKTDFNDRDEDADETINFDSRMTDALEEKTIIFERLSGNSANATTTVVTITDGIGHTSEITVNSEGRIDWTN